MHSHRPTNPAISGTRMQGPGHVGWFAPSRPASDTDDAETEPFVSPPEADEPG